MFRTNIVPLLLVTVVLLHQVESLLLDGTDDQGIESRLGALEHLTKNLSQRLSEAESSLNECHGQGSSYPAFMALLAAEISHCSPNQHVIFETVTTNVGGGYNNVHGVFTAPVAGTYSFSVTLAVTPGPDNDFHTKLVKNDAANVIGYVWADPHDIWTRRSINVVVQLDVDDEVWLVCFLDSKITGSNGLNNRPHNAFFSHISGFLISPSPPA